MNISSVTEYSPTGSQAEQLLQYPYARPETSYLTDGETVYELPEAYESFEAAADTYLTEHNLPSMSERVPVVAYGANVSPYKLHDKMSGYGKGAETDALLQTVPNIRVAIPHTTIAWHGKPGQVGSIFAELYKSEQTVGETAVAFVQYLTKEQIALLHATEGITYHFSAIEVLAGSTKTPLRAAAYVAGNSEILMKNDRVIQVAACARPEAGQTMTAQEAMEYVLSHSKEAAGTDSPTAYIESAPAVLKDKKARQERVRGALAQAGISRQFSFPGADAYKGRADFNFDTHLDGGKQHVELMEQSVARLRIRDLEDPANKKDIAEVLRRRAHDELAERIAK